MQSWDLLAIEAPDGTRDPVVLHSDEARAVLIRIDPGQELREHQVRERSWISVVEGTALISAGDESIEAPPGTLVTFAPHERHAVRSEGGARILLLLAPWPAPDHYEAEEKAVVSP